MSAGTACFKQVGTHTTEALGKQGKTPLHYETCSMVGGQYLACPNLVSLYSLVDSEAYYIIPYITNKMALKTVAIVYHAATYGEAFGASTEKLARERGLVVTRREVVSHEEIDFRGVSAKIIKDHPDVVITHLSAEKEGFFIKQLRHLGFRGTIFATFTFEAPDVKVAGGESLGGVLYTYPSEVSQESDLYREFLTRYRERFKIEPTATAGMAYDGVHLIDQAVSQCQDKGTACLTAFFSNLGTYSGAGGRVVFGKDRSAIRPFGLKTVKDGGTCGWRESYLSWENLNKSHLDFFNDGRISGYLN